MEELNARHIHMYSLMSSNHITQCKTYTTAKLNNVLYKTQDCKKNSATHMICTLVSQPAIIEAL